MKTATSPSYIYHRVPRTDGRLSLAVLSRDPFAKSQGMKFVIWFRAAVFTSARNLSRDSVWPGAAADWWDVGPIIWLQLSEEKQR